MISQNIYQFIFSLKEEMGLLLSISFGIFLFILFFQPFPMRTFDFESLLVFVAGFGAIVFILMVIVRFVLPGLFRKPGAGKEEMVLSAFQGGFILLVLSSVAFAFYLRYVGSVQLTFYIMFKVFLVCLAPPVILSVYGQYKELKQQNEQLTQQNELIRQKMEQYEEDSLYKTIEFVSDYQSKNLKLLVSDVVYIKSADNYVEIVYKEDENYTKTLLRSTLKEIERQLKSYPHFIRCHRAYIVNKYFIQKLSNNYSSHWISLKGSNDTIPVSRQYLVKIKEVF